MPQIELVAASDDVPFSVHLDRVASKTDPQQLHLKLGTSSKLVLDVVPESIVVPDGLLDAAQTRLLSFSELRSQAIDKVAELEQSWHRIVDQCANFTVTLKTSAGGAVLLNGVEVISGATLASAVFVLNLRAHLVHAAQLHATLALRLACSVTLPPGRQVSTRLGLEVVVDGEIPRFTFTIPELPFRLPEIPWPEFDWAQLPATDLSWPQVRLPSLPFLPIGISCQQATFVGSSAAGKLEFTLKITGVELALAGNKVAWGDLTVTQKNNDLKFDYALTFPPLSWSLQPTRLPGPLDALELIAENGTLELQGTQANGDANLQGVLKAKLTVRSHAEPTKTVVIEVALPFQGDKLVDSLDLGGGNTARRAIRLVRANVPLDSLVADLPDGFAISLRFGSLPLPELKAVAELLAEVLAALGRALAGLARLVQRVVEALASKLVEALSALEVTLILERDTGNLQQVLFSVHRSRKDGELIWDRMGFRVAVPADVDVALLVDLRRGRRDAYVVATSETGGTGTVASVATDLWLGTPTTERPTGDLSSQPEKKSHLIEAGIARKGATTGRVSVVPFGIRAGRATFLHALNPPLPELGKPPSVVFTGFDLVPVADQFSETFKLAEDAKDRLLPFLSAPKDESSSGGGIADTLKQYIKIVNFEQPTVENGVARAKLDVEINALGSKLGTALKLELDVRTLTARISGGALAITVPGNFDLLGMKADFVDTKTGQAVTEKQVVLDLGGSDPRLYLNDGISLRLKFEKLSTAGKPLTFQVDKFVMHSGGLDLDASLAAEATIPLNGLGTDYTFKAARLSVREGRVSAFALTATGKLPPALLGDVDTRLHLNFALRNGRFALSDGSLELVNKGKPIRSEQTHFVFTMDGLAVRAFEEDGSLHFCAFVSGSALFKPEVAELADGMFKKLAGVELSFTDCPVCGASKVIERELRKLNLSFVVALDEPARATLFDLFEFEVRSIGLEPSCKMWDDTPAAIVIGGQVTFAETGDVVRAECDFHKLYIAPPSKGFLPRIKCEGLGVAIRLGSAFEIEGKVVAVDGRMPDNVLETRRPQDSLQANGFMGQGRVAIEGLPPIAASFGFVEVRETPESAPLRAWFVYLEAQHLSYYFQLGPIPLYLREVGLGLGFHFTYVGIKAIDNANSLPEILPALDTIAANAQEPAKLDSWSVDKRKGLTLVARAMISMSSASAPTEALVWKPEEEKDLPNILLLNVVMAMRNTTFMMTANAWLGWNYSDWDVRRKIERNDLVGKQSMTGYVVLVGSRSEFLARLKSNPGAEVGDRLALPDAFKSALRDIQYEATLYIRPGLLHFELGWPNKLRWTKNIAGANLSVAGGAIFRVHEETLLAGLNLEGRLDFSISGKLDAGAVGIAVSASVHAALIARMIGYLDARKVSNSLYYSLFSLQVHVTFSVSAWLEIKAWMCKITIRASFSLSLQIDVLAELAIGGNGSMGTRVRATISVSIFGRSLGLSVGLSANPSLVNAASARASRFLQVGLEQDVPAVSPPFSQQNDNLQQAANTGMERRQAQAVAASVNSHGDGLAPVPIEEVIPEAFSEAVAHTAWQDIGSTDFQVVATYPTVLPMAGDPREWVYLTFVPLDGKDGGPHTASFYAAPQAGTTTDADHRVVFSGLTNQDGDVLRWNGSKWEPMTVAETRLAETRVAWDKPMAYEESTRRKDASPEPDVDEVAELRDLFFAAFRTKASSAGPDTEYFEPQLRPEREFSEGQRRAAGNPGEAHLAQQRRYASMIEQDPADRRCHEARDFLLHKFFSDLFAYGETATPSSQVNVLDLGLTFLVRRSVLNDPVIGYVDKRVVFEGQPVWKRSSGCRIFNPPTKTFGDRPPRFESLYSDTGTGKVRLDWELDWDFDDVENVEDYLHCYEIRRSIDLGERQIESPLIRVKRADGDSIEGGVRKIVRNEWQFTDEFDDLSPADRRTLNEAMGKAVIRYTITPICVSNTRGRACSAFVLRFGGQPELGAPRNATAFFTLDPAATTPEKQLRMAIDMEADAPTLRTGERHWQLVLRPEEIVPSGQYGVDAETQSSLGSWLSSSGVLQPGDEEIRIATGKPDKDGIIRLEILDDHAVAPRLRAVLMDTSNPRAWRIIARQIVVLDPTGDPDDATVFSSAPTEVEIGVHLVRAKTTAEQRENGEEHDNTFLKPGRFEYIRQPQPEERHVLLPVFADQIAPVESGRAVRPMPDGKQVRFGSHPEFGAATRLTWNVVPNDTTDADLRRYRMLAGFDIWRLDLDSATAKKQDWSRAWRVTCTRLLGKDKITLLPGEVGEVSNWKASYPSELARRRANGAWYSEAESYIEWPRVEPRFELLPEPSQDLLTSLLSKGVPKVIRLSMRRDPQPVPEPVPSEITWTFRLLAGAGTPIDLAWHLENGNELHFDGPADIGAESLRSALRRLGASLAGIDDAGVPAGQLRGWRLGLACLFLPKENASPLELHSEEVSLDYERDLHPLLESIIARMRRLPDRLLDADRRPPPVLKSTTVDAFVATTGGADDPYGWLVMDRLGLGVTLRLYDAFDDKYLGQADLHEQLHLALEQIRHDGIHIEASKQLAVEWLLKPGAMVQTASFESRPDADGNFGSDEEAPWLREHALDMVRISVRPCVKQVYDYWVGKVSSVDLRDDKVTDFHAMLDGDTTATHVTNTRQLKTLLDAADARSTTARAHWVFMRAALPFGGIDSAKDSAPGSAPDSPDAYGRFPAVDWRLDPSILAQVDRFRVLLSRALGTQPPTEKEAELPTWWLRYNDRFFEHAAASASSDAPTFAYAATEADEPTSVASDRYGQVSVVLPEADGYAHQFAYAIRPRWRYEALLEASGHPVPADLVREITDAGVQCAMATVERTAPVLPPALISLGRIGGGVWWQGVDGRLVRHPPGEKPADMSRLGSDDGSSTVVLLPHHPERRLSRSNTPAQRSLSHAGELYTQVAMLADPAWCEAFLQKEPEILDAQAKAAVDADVSAVDELDPANRSLPPFDRARLRVVSYLPHWYRHLAVAAATSGSAASVPTAVHLAESAARLVMIDPGNGTVSLVPHHPWKGHTTVDSTGVEQMTVQASPGPVHAEFGVSFDLLRYRDTTDPVTAELWPGSVAAVPDPGVTYQVDLVVPAKPAEGEPRKSVTPIARIVRDEGNPSHPFKVIPISKEWRISLAQNGLTLKVNLSPHGKGLSSQGLPGDAFPGFHRDADGALRVPGGWSLGWLTELLSRLPQGTAEQQLAWTAQLWKRLDIDAIGVPVGDSLYAGLEAAQIGTMKVTLSDNETERKELSDALLAWTHTQPADTAGNRIARLVRDRIEAALQQWPASGKQLTMEVPWLTSMVPPESKDISVTFAGTPRHLLPDLMTSTEVGLLDGVDRAQALWTSQKRQAMEGGGQLVITALRGDAVPLQLNPFELV